MHTRYSWALLCTDQQLWLNKWNSQSIVFLDWITKKIKKKSWIDVIWLLQTDRKFLSNAQSTACHIGVKYGTNTSNNSSQCLNSCRHYMVEEWTDQGWTCWSDVVGCWCLKGGHPQQQRCWCAGLASLGYLPRCHPGSLSRLPHIGTSVTETDKCLAAV